MFFGVNAPSHCYPEISRLQWTKSSCNSRFPNNARNCSPGSRLQFVMINFNIPLMPSHCYPEISRLQWTKSSCHSRFPINARNCSPGSRLQFVMINFNIPLMPSHCYPEISRLQWTNLCQQLIEVQNKVDVRNEVKELIIEQASNGVSDKPSTIYNEIRSSLAEKYKSDDALILPGKDEMMNLIRNSRSSLVGGNTWEKLMLPEYFLVSKSCIYSWKLPVHTHRYAWKRRDASTATIWESCSVQAA
jgi:hypothetical protein